MRRRRLTEATHRQLVSELDKHAGRARWDISQRLDSVRLRFEAAMRDQLAEVIDGVFPPDRPHPQLLVGFDTGDDAAAWQLDDEAALVVTVDFITPVVDEPGAWGRGRWLTVGVHLVEDPEPKFGLAVVGTVDPIRVLTNTGLRPGDPLVLSKALGTGIIATAVKAGTAPEAVVPPPLPR